jgi:transposase
VILGEWVRVGCASFLSQFGCIVRRGRVPSWSPDQNGGDLAIYKKYIVRLTEEQRTQLETLVRSGRAHARKLLYGRILLKADADGPDHWTDEKIADAFEVSTATVARERRRLCEEGLEVALMPRKPGRPRRRVLDGRAEAHLVALSCSEPPEGRERWSLRLLADRMVELGYTDELSYETVRRTLKKTSSSLISNVSG